MRELQNLKVNIRLQTRVKESAQMSDGRQELMLSDGSQLITDMYIPAYGLVPNSSYAPSKFLNANGFVIVDEYLKVRGAEGVWAIGDVSATEPCQFITCDKQSVYLAKNIIAVLRNEVPLPYKVAPSRTVTIYLTP